MKLSARLKNKKVKQKLNFYKMSMIFVILLLGVVAIAMSMLTNAKMKEITEVWSPSLSRVEQLDNLTATYRMRQYGHLVAQNEAEIVNYETMLADVDKEIAEVNKEFDAVITMPEERQLFEDAKAMWAKYKEQSAPVLEKSRLGQTADAAALMLGDAYTTFQEFNGTFGKLLDLERNEIAKAKKVVNIVYYIMVASVLLAVALGAVLATTLANAVTKMITEPIAQIRKAADRLNQGDMSGAELLTYESEDEMGDVSHALADSMRILDDYIKEISTTLREIAKGDLTKDSDEITEFRGDFADIKESFVYILKRFNSTLTDIQNTSHQVASSSKEIAGASQTLADGAADQASAIEELTASIGTVAGIAEESAKETQAAYDRVRISTEKAEQEKERMAELTREMAKITEISKEIENIITAIEDIASQTNLLSLNASIEAARAGEAGRGFAVVADQIGKLATDSAKSAVDTRELIQKTLVEIENGNAITVATSAGFEKIIDDMKQFAEMAQKTSESANNQSAALEQIEQGVDQIAEVVQNTAAASEETTAVSENLSEEAIVLDKLVNKFKLY